jgi:NitT/TauT family transport system substrate-binding protein
MNTPSEPAASSACGSLVRDDKPAAAALTRAILESENYAVHHPEEAAASYAPFAAGKVPIEDLVALARYHTHHQHPVGAELKRQLALYADELKLVSVFRPSMNTAKYADRIYADVLA